jgi:hypothetical protein
MPVERDDPSRYGVTEDTDPAILIGALDDERIGLGQERDARQADDREDAVAGEGGGPTAPPPAELRRTRQGGPGFGDLPVPEVMQDADPAMLVGALDDERMGLNEERDAEPDDAAE